MSRNFDKRIERLERSFIDFSDDVPVFAVRHPQEQRGPNGEYIWEVEEFFCCLPGRPQIPPKRHLEPCTDPDEIKKYFRF